jgi:hypothetical protein
MIINSTNINKMNNHLSSSSSSEYKKTTTYDDGNPGPSWLVTDTDAGVQQVNGS